MKKSIKLMLVIISIIMVLCFNLLSKNFKQQENISVLSLNEKDQWVYIGGNSIGVKLKTLGVLVVALSDVENLKGEILSPAAVAGIRIGDTILSVNNEKINSSYEFSKKINQSKGLELNIKLQRDENIMDKSIKSEITKSGECKIGVWVRESTAGIGTLTFYDKNTGKFAALGHAITDVDTNQILKVGDGSIVESSIISIKKGEKGSPGELRGILFEEEKPIGKIKTNTSCGIYGISNEEIIKKFNLELVPVAKINEIQEGPAEIITTILGGERKTYSIRIDKLLEQNVPTTKSMLIVVTDKELLEKTGGIVQGMSGSPILQNGKFIGAITHVLINKPEVGYGIYSEWMINELGKF